MQLPKLRLPSISFGGAGRAVLLYGAYTLILFLVFLVATFPHDMIIRQAMAAAGLTGDKAPIEFSDVKFAWWRGYQIDGLRIPPQGGSENSLLEIAHLWVRPTLRDLIRGNPYSFNLTAELYGGSAAGQFDYKNGAVRGDVAWDGINLGRYRPLVSLLEEGEVTGRISGLLSFDAPLRGATGVQVAGDITLDAAMIKGGKIPGFTLGDLGLKQAKLKFKGGGGKVELQELTVNGDLTVQQTSGQIGLRDSFPDSSLNLRANIMQTPTTPDWLKTLLAAIPRQPGAKLDAPVNISGTVGKPRFR